MAHVQNRTLLCEFDEFFNRKFLCLHLLQYLGLQFQLVLLRKLTYLNLRTLLGVLFNLRRNRRLLVGFLWTFPHLMQILWIAKRVDTCVEVLVHRNIHGYCRVLSLKHILPPRMVHQLFMALGRFYFETVIILQRRSVWSVGMQTQVCCFCQRISINKKIQRILRVLFRNLEVSIEASFILVRDASVDRCFHGRLNRRHLLFNVIRLSLRINDNGFLNNDLLCYFK